MKVERVRVVNTVAEGSSTMKVFKGNFLALKKAVERIALFNLT